MNNVVESLILDPKTFYRLIMQPGLEDVVPDFTGIYPGLFGGFTVFPEVSLARGERIIDLYTRGNLLQRKDRSCNVNWQQFGTTSNRLITVTELYGASAQCFEEFYEGDFRDFRDNVQVFLDMMVKRFGKVIFRDLLSNTFFGDVNRANDNIADPIIGTVAWNQFDGLVKKVGNYIASGTIPAAQSTAMGALPSGAMSPLDAFNALKAMFDAQNDVMLGIDDRDIEIHIDYKWAHAYSRYLQQSGVGSVKAVDYIQNGVPVLGFEGIPIYVERSWNPVLRKLNKVSGTPTEAHMGYLTLRGNPCFGTNSSYGGGPLLDRAFEVYYDWHDRQWKVIMNLVAGAELMAPQLMVFNITNIGTYA